MINLFWLCNINHINDEALFLMLWEIAWPCCWFVLQYCVKILMAFKWIINCSMITLSYYLFHMLHLYWLNFWSEIAKKVFVVRSLPLFLLEVSLKKLPKKEDEIIEDVISRLLTSLLQRMWSIMGKNGKHSLSFCVLHFSSLNFHPWGIIGICCCFRLKLYNIKISCKWTE